MPDHDSSLVVGGIIDKPAYVDAVAGRQVEYERIKSLLPWYVQEQLPPKLDHSEIFHTTIVHKIPVWQFNKIRKLLQKVFHSHGMRTRYRRFDTFLWGMALSVPDNHVIDQEVTSKRWENNREIMWRNVWIYRIQLDQEMSYVDDALGGIPFLGGIAKGVFSSGLRASTLKYIPVFENFAYKNTMSSELIICNWDKIIRVLNNAGY